MRIALAGDHAGFQLKEQLKLYLLGISCQVLDLGALGEVASDYPDFAEAVGQAVDSRVAEKGILVCGSGVGVCVAANKHPGIRAGLCHDHYSAHQGVEHDDMNVLCMGSRIIGLEVAKEIVQAFVVARFSGEARHLQRLNKTKAIEAKYFKG